VTKTKIKSENPILRAKKRDCIAIYIHIERHQYKKKKSHARERGEEIRIALFEEQIIGHRSTAILRVILNSCLF
jgi:hypothetical protein